MKLSTEINKAEIKQEVRKLIRRFREIDKEMNKSRRDEMDYYLVDKCK